MNEFSDSGHLTGFDVPLFAVIPVVLVLYAVGISLLNEPLGPLALGVIFLLVIAAPIDLYRDARKRDVDHAAPIAILVFVALLLGIVPGVIAIALYWYLRDSLATESTDESVASG